MGGVDDGRGYGWNLMRMVWDGGFCWVCVCWTIWERDRNRNELYDGMR